MIFGWPLFLGGGSLPPLPPPPPPGLSLMGIPSMPATPFGPFDPTRPAAGPSPLAQAAADRQGLLGSYEELGEGGGMLAPTTTWRGMNGLIPPRTQAEEAAAAQALDADLRAQRAQAQAMQQYDMMRRLAAPEPQIERARAQAEKAYEQSYDAQRMVTERRLSGVNFDSPLAVRAITTAPIPAPNPPAPPDVVEVAPRARVFPIPKDET